ncbi:NUDIX domain-containing protein [Candidatus Uhrbacteria bacterium]|nr:NUDIX domain-containing protein [Candidatus Uhrbacteria bacterium]
MPHIHEKIDFTAEVFIVYGHQVLLRLHDKYKLWLSVGGHIELNEDPTETAIREVKEEVGLDVTLVGEIPQTEPEKAGYKELLPPRFLNRHRINESHEHVTFVYFAKSDTDEVIASGDDRSDDWKWFTFQELEDPAYALKPSIKHYAQEALKELG